MDKNIKDNGKKPEKGQPFKSFKNESSQNSEETFGENLAKHAISDMIDAKIRREEESKAEEERIRAKRHEIHKNVRSFIRECYNLDVAPESVIAHILRKENISLHAIPKDDDNKRKTFELLVNAILHLAKKYDGRGVMTSQMKEVRDLADKFIDKYRGCDFMPDFTPIYWREVKPQSNNTTFDVHGPNRVYDQDVKTDYPKFDKHINDHSYTHKGCDFNHHSYAANQKPGTYEIDIDDVDPDDYDDEADAMMDSLLSFFRKNNYNYVWL